MDMYFERSLAVLLVAALVDDSRLRGARGVSEPKCGGKVTFEGVGQSPAQLPSRPIEGTKGPSVGGAIKGGEYHIRRGEGP